MHSLRLVVLVLACSATCSAPVWSYTIARFEGESGWGDHHSTINEQGQTAWVGRGGTRVYLREAGGAVTRLDTNTAGKNLPAINATGDVTWWDTDGDVWVHRHSVLSELTTSGSDQYPDINASGLVAWRGQDGSDFEIYLDDGLSLSQLTDNTIHDYSPRLNDLGEVAWYAGLYDIGTNRYDYDVYLHSDGSTSMLWDNPSYFYNGGAPSPVINNAGQVAWHAWDSSASNWEIGWYDPDSGASVLTDTAASESGVRINGAGRLVWAALDGGYTGVYLWDNLSGAVKLSEDGVDARTPWISDTGMVVWTQHDGNDYEVFLWTPHGGREQVTDNQFDDSNPEIAGRWMVWEGDGDIFAAHVPEPGLLPLFSLGLLAIGVLRRKLGHPHRDR